MSEPLIKVLCPACHGSGKLDDLDEWPTRCHYCGGTGGVVHTPAQHLAWRMKDCNTRFWWWGRKGWVRITLKPGQWLSWGWAEPHEEGYSYERIEWHHAGSVIECLIDSGGSDCDGPIAHHTKLVCPISEMDGDFRPDLEVLRPNWRKAGSVTRDTYAEAAGY